jgi:hypothetical protein
MRRDEIFYQISHFFCAMLSYFLNLAVPITILFIFFQWIDVYEKKEDSDTTQNDVIFFTAGLFAGALLKFFLHFH